MISAERAQAHQSRQGWLAFIRRMEPVFFISPAFIVIGITLVYPLGYSLWLSFHEWTLRGFREGVPYVGLQNYIDLFKNPDFINSLRITAEFVILAVGIEFVLGMGLALLLHHDLRGKRAGGHGGKASSDGQADGMSGHGVDSFAPVYGARVGN